jgi:ATP-dependent RNA helicase DDX35
MSAFWKPGEAGPTLDAEVEKFESANTTTFHYNPNVSRDVKRQRLLLPIAHFREAILYHVSNFRTLIVLGLSGCGKSTQIPQYLYEAGWASSNYDTNSNSSSSTSSFSNSQIIASVQPTRISALLLATRIAEECGSNVGKGGIVGCNVQYFPHVDHSTCKIKILTYETILREVYRDPLLLKYSVIIIDQVDERTKDMDILLGVVKNIKTKRPELRLILCGATTSAVKFKSFFDSSSNMKKKNSEAENAVENNAATITTFDSNDKNTAIRPIDDTNDNEKTKIICVSHKSEEPQVSTYYLEKPCGDFIKETVRTVLRIVNGTYDGSETDGSGGSSYVSGNRDGGILVFMPGLFEVETTVRWLKDELLPYDNAYNGNLYSRKRSHNQRDNNSNNNNNNKYASTTVLPLHGKLSNKEQLRCFLKPRNGERKIVVATNIAETSLTVPGIDYVIDTMYTRMAYYDARTGKQSIGTVPVSEMSAIQRADRAGRNNMKIGKCFRLCTFASFQTLEEEQIPEICRSDLIQQVLYLKGIGVFDFSQFAFVDMPDLHSFARAFDILHALGAINDDATLTMTGQTLCRFQCSPCIAKILLNSLETNCTEEILSICAMLQVKNVFVHPRKQNKLKEATEVFKEFASVHSSDHLTLLTVYNQFTGMFGRSSRKWSQTNFCNHNSLLRAKSIRKEMAHQLKKSIPPGQTFSSCGEDDNETILKCLLSGFFVNIVRKERGDYIYKTVKDSREVKFDKFSVLEMFPANVEDPPQWLMYYDAYDKGNTEGEIIYNISVIPDILWLLEVAPHYYELKHSQHSINPDGSVDYLKDFKVDYSLVEDGGGNNTNTRKRRRERKRRTIAENNNKSSPSAAATISANNSKNTNMMFVSSADRSKLSPTIYNETNDNTYDDLKQQNREAPMLVATLPEQDRDEEKIKKNKLKIKEEEESRKNKRKLKRKKRRELNKKKRKMTVAQLLGGGTNT